MAKIVLIFSRFNAERTKILRAFNEPPDWDRDLEPGSMIGRLPT